MVRNLPPVLCSYGNMAQLSGIVCMPVLKDAEDDCRKYSHMGKCAYSGGNSSSEFSVRCGKKRMNAPLSARWNPCKRGVRGADYLKETHQHQWTLRWWSE